ncbi:MAG: PadR family transcriptional regulator, partial [Marmoricola sp.]
MIDDLSTSPRVSSLGHALLGLLARQDATGYDLAQQMRHPVGYFWEAGHSQIYPELARLERAGLVGHAVVEGRGPRPTKRYSLTDAGRQVQVAWLEATMRPEPSRDLQTLRT